MGKSFFERAASGSGETPPGDKYSFKPEDKSSKPVFGKAVRDDSGKVEGELTMSAAERRARDMPELAKLFIDLDASLAAVTSGYGVTTGPNNDGDIITRSKKGINVILARKGENPLFTEDI